MQNYELQRRPGSTLFRAKSAKEAMAEARLAFGPDVEILSVERVGKVYCLEVCGPTADGPESNAKRGPHATQPYQPTPLDFLAAGDRASMDGVARLERKFEELSARIEMSGHHQATGLASIGNIRESLLGFGFAEPFVGKLAGAMIEAGANQASRESIMKILSSWLGQLGVAADFESGFHAVVGPAGSGKTTTIAKLASRACATWGSEAVGLVTTDFFRIGAYEQLRVFGELLGVKVHPARSSQEFAEIIKKLNGKKVVFIDTVGTGRDDEKMREQMELLNSHGVQSTMALQACLARSVIRNDLGRWREAGARSAILTKLDQATGIASVVEAMIIKSMPVMFATNGQRVPADLHKISPLLLAHKALRSDGAS